MRTPVAIICAAYVQRLRAKLIDPEIAKKAVEIEQALKRLTRLVERLSCRCRVQSGLGMSAVKADILPALPLLIRELRTQA
jgi:two-component system OmpR family sensor kinase